MRTYFICQTDSYKTCVVLPDEWSGLLRRILSKIFDFGGVFLIFRSDYDYSLSKTIFGPNRMFLHINIRRLLQEEAEPSIEMTRDYFEGLSYRQNYHEVSTNTIDVLSKRHFTAKYYRINRSGAQYNKKYCLYIERLEYLFTAVLASVTRDQGRPEESAIMRNENTYDDIVRSLHLVEK